MIVLKRQTPEQLAYYDVLMRLASLADKFAKLYHQIKSGYIGERRLDREWKDLKLNGLLFHDFTCFNEAGHPHQIDTIFVCKHFVLVIEVKNITGRIDFNAQTRQLIRTREDGVAEVFHSPIDQVKRHRTLIDNHFLHLPEHIPVESAVIITNPYCLIGKTGNEIPMFAVQGLRSFIEQLTARYQHITLNTKQIRESLMQLYRPHTRQPWRQNDVAIKNGVLCLNCNNKMTLTPKGFKCFTCNLLDHADQAIRRTLLDYRVLYSAKISNQQFRNFTEITSRHTAYAILNRLLPDRTIAGRGSQYTIPPDIYTFNI